MRRFIDSVFQYTDYKVILLNDFTARSTHNNNYSLRAYARDLQLSPGYLSSILRGKKNLNKDNWISVFQKIGIEDKLELDFVEKLLIYNTSPNQNERVESLQYIRNHYESLELKDKSDRDYFLNSPQLLIVYMILSQCSQLEIALKLANSLGLSDDQFSEAFKELCEHKYIFAQEGGSYQVIDKNLAIISSQKILNSARQLSSYLFHHMEKSGGISFPQKSTQTLVLGFDQESFEQAIEVYKHFLHQIYRISKNSKKIDRITIFSDILFTTSAENT